MKQVVFVTRVLTHYRLTFHLAVRRNLAQVGITYRLVHGTASASELKKGDLATLEWAEPIRTRYFAKTRLSWLSLPPLASADLIVIGQENGNLNNYGLQIWSLVGGPKIAFFGHGKNFQAPDRNSRAERFKRFWVNKVDWWFAYTQRSADIVAAAGFPADRITVFNNSIDTSAIQVELAAISEAEKTALRTSRFAGSRNIGVFIGGLYDLKRIDFLIDSAIRVRQRVPDFQLMIIGGGPDAARVQAAAKQHPWIHALGPQFGREKTLLASLGRVFLMPGLVGLGVLDSFSYGTPMVTTDLPYHSPEIDYLENGVSGVIVGQKDSVETYAAAVERILNDECWRDRLRAGATEALSNYTVENMARRFSDGVIKAVNR